MDLPFFREMLFLQERDGALWSLFFPVRVASFQKGFAIIMSDLPPLQMSFLRNHMPKPLTEKPGDWREKCKHCVFRIGSVLLMHLHKGIKTPLDRTGPPKIVKMSTLDIHRLPILIHNNISCDSLLKPSCREDSNVGSRYFCVMNKTNLYTVDLKTPS